MRLVWPKDTLCTFHLNCGRLNGFYVVKKQLPHQKALVNRKHRPYSGACAVLSYLGPSGEVERELRKLNGIRKITINPLFGTVKIRYDPNITTVEKIRSVAKRPGSRREP